MRRQTVIRNLEHARQWLLDRRKKPSKSGEPWEAQNIFVGCVQLLNQCGRSIQEWLGRRPDRRRVLKQIREKYVTNRGNVVLRRLVDLTVTELKACSWRDDFWIGALPIKFGQRKLSEAHKRAIRAARERSQEQREIARKARLEYETASDTTPIKTASKSAKSLGPERPVGTQPAFPGSRGSRSGQVRGSGVKA